MSTACIYELLLALGRSVCNDADRRRRSTLTNHSTVLAPTIARTKQPPPPTAKQLQHLAYEVLLRGAPPQTASAAAAEADIIEELRFVQFEIAFSDAERSKQLGASIDRLQSASVAAGDIGISVELHSMLRMLLALRDTVPTAKPRSRESQIFGPLSSQSAAAVNVYTNNMRWNLSVRDSELPSFFQIDRLDVEKRKHNPFLPKQLNVVESQGDPKVETASANPEPTIPPLKQPNRTPSKPSGAALHMKCHSWDYVNVPLYKHRAEPQFVSESEQSLPYVLHKSSSNAASTESPKITLRLGTADMVSDLKRLLVGTASQSFRFDEETLTFAIVDGVALMYGTSETMASRSVEMLECGTCCARLRLMCNRDAEFGYKFEGFVFRTICSTVEDFLDVFERFVQEFTDDSVLQLARRMAPMMRQIRQLAKLFVIHPKVTPDDPSDILPQGAAFLDHLHREITTISRPDEAVLFTHLLQEACRVYYRNFELWLFHGRIEDPHEELFIEFTDCPWPHSKQFWDRAFRVRTDDPTTAAADATPMAGAVPAFLLGTEQRTLLCGKYTGLLRAIRPEHPLLRVAPPRLDVCLTDGELAALQLRCRAYGQRLQRVCGAPVSVRAVYDSRAAQRRECVRQATERFGENMRRWREQQDESAAKRRLVHAAQRAALELQIKELHDRRVTERRENMLLEREVIRRAEELEDVQTARERAEREKRIEYYEELAEMAGARHTKADAVVEDLRVRLAEAEALTAQMASAVGMATMAGEKEEVETDKEHGDLNRNVATKEFVEIPSILIPIPDTIDNSNLTPSHNDIPTRSIDANANPTSPSSRNTNKAMVLGSTFDFQHHETAGRQATEMLANADATNDVHQSATLTDANSNPCPSTSAHTEMLQNRARIMGQEYDLIGFTTEITPAKTSDPKAELTDLQRNRRKIMSQEFGMHLDLETAARNGKLMVRETPMSTSSDTPAKRIEDELKSLEMQSAMEPLKVDVNLGVTTTALNSSEMQTAATSQSEQLFRFELQPSPAASTLYESARSGIDVDNSVTETVGQEKEKNASKSPSRFGYPKTLKLSKNVSTFFPVDSPFDSHEKATNTEDATEALPTFDPDSLAADFSSLTARLRTSYLLPLQTHLRVLSNEVLKVFLHELHLLQHFKSLRNYFFMMDGEFGGNISDGLFAKLQPDVRPVDILNFACLHSLLDNALGSSIIGNDPNAERLSFIVDDLPAAFDLGSPHVLQMLRLTYAVEWPLNLLLSPEAIGHYARIFQHLLTLRRCRFVLDGASQLLKEVAKRREVEGNGLKGLSGMSGAKCWRSPQYGRVQQIRNKLLQFVMALQNHVTATALQASWRRFKLDLAAAESMEDCYQMHARYLKRVEFLCMLNRSSAKFYKALESVMVLVLRFYHKLKRHEWQLDRTTGFYTHAGFERLVAIEADFDKLMPYLIHMGEKIARRGYQTEIEDLISLINFNGFYEAVRHK